MIADEVFLDYADGTEPPSTFASDSPALTFTLSGLSKISLLPQMKLGWIVVSGPDELVHAADAAAGRDRRHLPFPEHAWAACACRNVKPCATICRRKCSKDSARIWNFSIRTYAARFGRSPETRRGLVRRAARSRYEVQMRTWRSSCSRIAMYLCIRDTSSISRAMASWSSA